jgi:hypothetical protein
MRLLLSLLLTLKLWEVAAGAREARQSSGIKSSGKKNNIKASQQHSILSFSFSLLLSLSLPLFPSLVNLLSLSIFFCLFVYLSNYLHIFLSISSACVLFPRLFLQPLPVEPSLSPFLSLSLTSSFSLSISISLSLSLSLHLSFSLSLSLPHSLSHRITIEKMLFRSLSLSLSPAFLFLCYLLTHNHTLNPYSPAPSILFSLSLSHPFYFFIPAFLSISISIPMRVHNMKRHQRHHISSIVVYTVHVPTIQFLCCESQISRSTDK